MTVNSARARTGAAMALGVVAAFAALGAWALSSPVGSGSDDDYHLESIWCAGGDADDRCATIDADTVSVPRAVATAGCFRHEPTQPARCPDETGPGDEMVPSPRHNYGDLYPDGYYATMNVLVTGNPTASVVAMRFANAAIALVAIGLTAAAVDRAGRRALAMAWLATLVPLGMFTLASNNPSAWAVVGVGTFWASFDAWWTRAGERRDGLCLMAMALSATLAITSRTDSAAYVALIAGAIVVPELFTTTPAAFVRRHRSRLAVPAVLVVAAGLTLVSNRQGTVALEGFDDTRVRVESAAEVWSHNIWSLPHLWTGALGSPPRVLGWLDVETTRAVWIPTVLVFFGLLGTAARFAGRRTLIVAAPLVAALTVLPLWILWQSRALIPDRVQPRYLLPLMFALVGIVVVRALRQRPGIVPRWALWVAAIGLSFANSVALHTNLRRHVTGTDRTGFVIDPDGGWWWSSGPGPMSLWFVGSVAFAVVCAVVAGWLVTTSPSPGVGAPAEVEPEPQPRPLVPAG